MGLFFLWGGEEGKRRMDMPEVGLFRVETRRVNHDGPNVPFHPFLFGHLNKLVKKPVMYIHTTPYASLVGTWFFW